MRKPNILILGAGPAGLGAAFQLAKRQLADVTVLEQRDRVGGNAGSFELSGLHLDYGSHRLHPACDEDILRDLRELLGDDLLTRPRHGRIHLKNRWVHFPLKPLDLALKLPPSFGMGVAADTLGRALSRRKLGGAGTETFASLLQHQLGRTICTEFYFPYAQKIWGIAPEELSPVQAERRVSANSIGKMMKKILTAPLKRGSTGGPHFYYPRKGYGQISESLCDAALRHGAKLRLNTRVKQVHCDMGRAVSVTCEHKASQSTLQADYVWSTIPITLLTRCLQPSAPEEVITAASRTRFRAMILIYLILEQDQFSEYDAHYFPTTDIAITRLSEPKNYSASSEPAGLTALCAELPCDTSDNYWTMADEELAKVVLGALASAGIPVQAPIREVHVRRLGFAYPIYQRGFEQHFAMQDRYVGKIDNLLVFGRQGLFAHDNTHHGLAMAYAAVDCLDSQGHFDSAKWQQYRTMFESHVVED